MFIEIKAISVRYMVRICFELIDPHLLQLFFSFFSFRYADNTMRMCIVLFHLVVTCLCVSTQGSLRLTKSPLHVFHSFAHLVARPSVKPGKRAVGDRSHTVVFAVKQRNLDALEAAVVAVSDPQSPQYGQHWTREQVGALTANREASDAVLAFLTRSHSGATVGKFYVHKNVVEHI